MSEYFLGDRKADERKRQKSEPQAETVKVTLLGDFLFPTAESTGCDPYNNTEGKTAKDLWRTRGDRR